MARTKKDKLKPSHQDMTLSPWKAPLRNTAFANHHLHSDNGLAKHFALRENMISMAAEQMPPSAIARMVSTQSAHHRESRCWEEKGVTGDNNHLWASPQRPWQKGGCHLWRNENASLQWANAGKNKRHGGREEGNKRWPLSYTGASERLFNCVWRRTEATAVNNLCAAGTLAGESWVHAIRTDLSVCTVCVLQWPSAVVRSKWRAHIRPLRAHIPSFPSFVSRTHPWLLLTTWH